MNRIKRCLAAAVALAMTGSLAACSDNRYVMEYDGTKINAGVYILNIYSEMSSQIAQMYYNQGITENYFDQEVEGKKLNDYLSDKALSATRDYAAIVTQFNALGLELTEEETQEISDTVSTMWDNYGELYEELGISKESAKLVYTADKMDEKLFEYYYGTEGVEAVSDGDLEAYVNENYLRYKTIAIAKSTNEDESAAALENKDAEALRDEYLQKASGVDFAGFDAIITEYNDYVAAQNAEESGEDTTEEDLVTVLPEGSEDSTQETEESTAETEESVPEAQDSEEQPAPDTEAESIVDPEPAELGEAQEDSLTEDQELEEAAEEVAEEAEEALESEAEEAEASDEDGDAETTDEATLEDAGDLEVLTDEESEEETEEEADPYANEQMVNYADYTEEDLQESYGQLATFIKGLDVGVATAYENDNNYYIVIKGDASERSGEYVSENRDTVLHALKDDDYRAKKDEWVKAIKFTDNTSALKKYSPKAIYDREEKYYNAQQG